VPPPAAGLREVHPGDRPTKGNPSKDVCPGTGLHEGQALSIDAAICDTFRPRRLGILGLLEGAYRPPGTGVYVPSRSGTWQAINRLPPRKIKPSTRCLGAWIIAAAPCGASSACAQMRQRTLS